MTFAVYAFMPAAGRSSGYEFVARRNGAWRKLNPNGVVTRFYAETYSSDSTVNDCWSAWTANTGIGRPMINVGPASNATAQSVTEVRLPFGLLRHLHRRLLQLEGLPNNGKLNATQNGLNACTR